jgi:hypothetical protein
LQAKRGQLCELNVAGQPSGLVHDVQVPPAQPSQRPLHALLQQTFCVAVTSTQKPLPQSLAAVHVWPLTSKQRPAKHWRVPPPVVQALPVEPISEVVSLSVTKAFGWHFALLRQAKSSTVAVTTRVFGVEAATSEQRLKSVAVAQAPPGAQRG